MRFQFPPWIQAASTTADHARAPMTPASHFIRENHLTCLEGCARNCPITSSVSFSGRLSPVLFSFELPGRRLDATEERMTVDSSSARSASPDGEVSFATEGSLYTLVVTRLLSREAETITAAPTSMASGMLSIYLSS